MQEEALMMGYGSSVIRCVSRCVVLALMVVVGAGASARAERSARHCAVGDVTAFSEAHFRTGKEDCQARLYDPGPHHFCEEDRFLLGILWLIFSDVRETFDLDHHETVEVIQAVDHRVTWSSIAGSIDLPLTRSAVKSLVFAEVDDDGNHYAEHIYFDHAYTFMGAGTSMPLALGTYGWGWGAYAPWAVTEENPEGFWEGGSGEVRVVSHETHLEMVAAGTWPRD
jgi:hypothetical protein